MARKLGKRSETGGIAADTAPVVRPFRQGSLDSYCGFYAVVNAMLRLRPDAFAEDGAASELFNTMVKAGGRICSPEELCGEGMDGSELEYVARAAIRHMRRKGHSFNLARPRFRRAVPIDRTTVWFGAGTATACSVILYIEHRDQAHWSVLKQIKGDRIELFDSDALRTVYIKQCVPTLIISYGQAVAKPRRHASV